jgi:hypothetical protein
MNIGVGTDSKVGQPKLSARGSGGAPPAPPAGSWAEPQCIKRGSGAKPQLPKICMQFEYRKWGPTVVFSSYY